MARPLRRHRRRHRYRGSQRAGQHAVKPEVKRPMLEARSGPVTRNPSSPLSPGSLAQVACILEVTARKAGNVHRSMDFDDGHYLDFLLSAAAIAGPLDQARELGVGHAVLDAVFATQR